MFVREAVLKWHTVVTRCTGRRELICSLLLRTAFACMDSWARGQPVFSCCVADWTRQAHTLTSFFKLSAMSLCTTNWSNVEGRYCAAREE
eukprot:scaffold67983_cov22-Tisochrysis_lutea.AAC.1